MFGKAKKIRELEKLLDYYKGLIDGLEHRITDVVDQNKDLMNRLMATTFQEFQVFNPDNVRHENETEYDALSDVENAGEVLDLGQIS